MEKCRYYKNHLPAQGDYAVVRVLSVETNSLVKVALAEYNDMESMIPFASTGLRVGRNETIQSVLSTLGKYFVVQVARIDMQTGFLDLDRRSVNDQTTNAALLNF